MEPWKKGLWFVNAKGFVRAKGRKNAEGEGLRVDGLVATEIVTRVVDGADGAQVEFAENTVRGKAVGL